MSTINPLGGVQSIRVPNRPLFGYGEGTVVLVEQGLYAEVVDARIERRHGSRDQYLYLRPIPTACVLNGIGEYSRPVMPLPTEDGA
jgi:hypothetical protein